MGDKRKIIIFVLIMAVVLIEVILSRRSAKQPAPSDNQNQVLSPVSQITATTPAINSAAYGRTPAGLSWPISNAQARITKKPFGIYITPKTSPVQPERFTGYHTGVDFETTPEEQDADVPISAVCSGKLLAARYASGYGGVAVQACKIAGADYTVIYGHIRLSSVSAKVGGALQAGQKLAVLGTGYSSETDGERKHLHLGVHKGTAVNILGYVQNKSQLSDWADFTALIKQ